MTKTEAVNILKKFHFNPIEIKSILKDIDNLEFFSLQEIVDNLNLLVYKGVPKTEICEVINLNHTLLFHDTEYLDKKLQEVIDDGNDLEEFLKNNPDGVC